jgi:hypothetical protein
VNLCHWCGEPVLRGKGNGKFCSRECCTDMHDELEHWYRYTVNWQGDQLEVPRELSLFQKYDQRQWHWQVDHVHVIGFGCTHVHAAGDVGWMVRGYERRKFLCQ